MDSALDIQVWPVRRDAQGRTGASGWVLMILENLGLVVPLILSVEVGESD